MGLFLNEQLPLYVNYGGSFKQTFAIKRQDSQNGDEFRNQIHNKVRLDYNFSYDEDQDIVTSDIIDFYHKVNGEFGVFRVRDWSDFSTNGFTGVPTSSDVQCLPFDPTATGIIDSWKIVRWYDNGTLDETNSARRDILLPVVGTVKLSYTGGVSPPYELVETTDFTVNYSTGEITIVNLAAAPFTPDGPIAGTIFGGCEFDIPCRFNGTPSVAFAYHNGLVVSGANIREVFNLPEPL